MTKNETIGAIITSAISDYYALVEASTEVVLKMMPPPPIPPEEARLAVTLGLIKDTSVELTVMIIKRLKNNGFAIGAF